MSKLKVLMGISFLFVLMGMFSSCSSEDDNLAALKEEVAMVKTAASAKEQFSEDLQNVFANIKNGEKPSLTTMQLNLLHASAVRMLKSEGVYTAELQKIDKQDKANTILAGTLYLGITYTSSKSQGRYLKTRSSEASVCYDSERAWQCLNEAVSDYVKELFLLDVYQTLHNTSCLTKRIAGEILETVLKRIAAKFGGMATDMLISISYNYFNCILSD